MPKNTESSALDMQRRGASEISSSNYLARLHEAVKNFTSALEAYEGENLMKINEEASSGESDGWGDMVEVDEDGISPSEDIRETPDAAKKILTQGQSLFDLLTDEQNCIFKISSEQVKKIKEQIQNLKNEIREFEKKQTGDLAKLLDDYGVKTCFLNLIRYCDNVSHNLNLMDQVITLFSANTNEESISPNKAVSSKAEATEENLNARYGQMLYNICNSIKQMATDKILQTYFINCSEEIYAQLEKFYLLYTQERILKLMKQLRNEVPYSMRKKINDNDIDEALEAFNKKIIAECGEAYDQGTHVAWRYCIDDERIRDEKPYLPVEDQVSEKKALNKKNDERINNLGFLPRSDSDSNEELERPLLNAMGTTFTEVGPDDSGAAKDFQRPSREAMEAAALGISSDTNDQTLVSAVSTEVRFAPPNEEHLAQLTFQMYDELNAQSSRVRTNRKLTPIEVPAESSSISTSSINEQTSSIDESLESFNVDLTIKKLQSVVETGRGDLKKIIEESVEKLNKLDNCGTKIKIVSALINELKRLKDFCLEDCLFYDITQAVSIINNFIKSLQVEDSVSNSVSSYSPSNASSASVRNSHNRSGSDLNDEPKGGKRQRTLSDHALLFSSNVPGGSSSDASSMETEGESEDSIIAAHP